MNARESLNTAIVCCVLIALVCGGLSANRHFRQSALDEKRQVFEREGKTSPCEVVDASKNISSQVMRTRSGAEFRTGRERVSSTSVTCRFLANGVERNDTFTVPSDLEKELEMIQRRAELASMVDDRFGHGAPVVEAMVNRADALLTVTYLPSDPKRAVLGPLTSKFPRATDDVDLSLGLSVTFGGLALVLGAVALMLRQPRQRDEDEPT